MANVIINDTNLTNIANAIREKNGTTDTFKPSEMAEAILAIEAGGGGYEPTDAELQIHHGSSNYDKSPYQNGFSYWVLKEYGDRVKIYAYSLTNNILCNFNQKVFDARFNIDRGCFGGLFQNSNHLEEITGEILPMTGSYSDGRVPIFSLYSMFFSCQRLRVINDDFIDSNKFVLYNTNDSNWGKYHQTFYNCHSLREIPAFYKNLKLNDGTLEHKVKYPDFAYSYNYYRCYALNKLEDIRVYVSKSDDTALTYNAFGGTFDECHNLYKLTFQTNPDGTPITAKWTSQTIDLSKYVGYVNGSNLYNYNSGITINSQIPNTTEDRFLERQWLSPSMSAETLNNRHSLEADSAKYGRTEAVETINSLPDTSAAGGNNIIKFKGAQGKYTDWMKARTNDSTYDSSISTLTEAEIAVAAAKGWTVSLV